MNITLALACVAQWVEHRPVNWKVARSIPDQDTRLRGRPDPLLGASERQSINVSLPLSPSLPLSLKNKLNYIKKTVCKIKRQAQRTTYCVIPLTRKAQKRQPRGDRECSSGSQRPERVGTWKLAQGAAEGHGLLCRVMKMLPDWLWWWLRNSECAKSTLSMTELWGIFITSQ